LEEKGLLPKSQAQDRSISKPKNIEDFVDYLGIEEKTSDSDDT
jgi:hypothetical protein